MRVDDAFSQQRRINERKKPSATSSKTGSADFRAALEKQEAVVFEEFSLSLDDLKREIDTAGDALDREPSLEQYQRFRDLIRELTKRVSTDAYRLKKVGLSRTKQYEIVKVINTELDALYRLVRKTQKDRIAVTNKIIRLKGLVVDVMS
ncbi:MAG: YaaR family protein [Spirochaetota bacterium]